MQWFSFCAECICGDATHEIDVTDVENLVDFDFSSTRKVTEKMTLSEASTKSSLDAFAAPSTDEEEVQESDDTFEEMTNTKKLLEMAVEETAQDIAVTTADSPFGNGYFIRIEKKGIIGMGIAISMLNDIGFGGWTSGGLKVNQILNRGLIR